MSVIDVVYDGGIYGCNLSLFILLCRAARRSVYSEVQTTTTSSMSPRFPQWARPSRPTPTSPPMAAREPTRPYQSENLQDTVASSVRSATTKPKEA